MSATPRIRRAQLRGAITSRHAQEIAILQQGRRLVHASVGSRQRAALAGITEYWTAHGTPIQLRPAGPDSGDTLDPDIFLAAKPIIPQPEIAVW
ncbi:MAG: hypothetical protein U1F70_06290 [Candidatus Competibacteraceae bacterium]